MSLHAPAPVVREDQSYLRAQATILSDKLSPSKLPALKDPYGWPPPRISNSPWVKPQVAPFIVQAHTVCDFG